jgi:hypothetical protein
MLLPIEHRKASARGDAIEFVQQLLSLESGSGAAASVGWYRYTFVVGWTVGATVAVAAAVAVAVAVGVGVPVGVGVDVRVGLAVGVLVGVGADPPPTIPPAKMTTTTTMAARKAPPTATKTKGFASLLIGPIIACLAPLSSHDPLSAGAG